jgi:hypothetical protein
MVLTLQLKGTDWQNGLKIRIQLFFCLQETLLTGKDTQTESEVMENNIAS